VMVLENGRVADGRGELSGLARRAGGEGRHSAEPPPSTSPEQTRGSGDREDRRLCVRRHPYDALRCAAVPGGDARGRLAKHLTEAAAPASRRRPCSARVGGVRYRAGTRQAARVAATHGDRPQLPDEGERPATRWKRMAGSWRRRPRRIDRSTGCLGPGRAAPVGRLRLR
jgi:hypothetical protein